MHLLRRLLEARRKRRTRLRDLHASGSVSVFRGRSLLRWLRLFSGPGPQS
ncbi:MAG: hypothetical protein NVV63_13140 [Opitutus sp.]|nr:hypothetical protein [Opitutus sp.]